MNLRGPIVASCMATILLVALYSCVQDRAQGAMVPCVLDKNVLCQQRKECKLCKICTDIKDQCCCLHTDKCVCNINRGGVELCCAVRSSE